MLDFGNLMSGVATYSPWVLPNIETQEFRKVVETRRSVRIFDGTPVPEDVMNSCFDLALLAPNTSNLQPWEFHWASSPAMREKVREYCMGQPAAQTASELIVCVARTRTWKRNSKDIQAVMKEKNFNFPKPFDVYYTKLVPLTYTSGFFNLVGLARRLLFFSMRVRKPMSRPPTSKREMITWGIKNCALACQTLMLAFRAHGFDSCAMDGYDPVRIKRLLNLPSDAYIAMVIGVGKRAAADQAFGQRVRLDREHFIKKI